jgi:predicted nucleotidyltransferase
MSQLSDIEAGIRQLKPELQRRFFVSSIGLFGSVVRDDFSESSDVDIIVDFSRPIGIEFVDLAEYLEEQLHKKVDLVSRNGIRDQYFKAIESEILYV